MSPVNVAVLTALVEMFVSAETEGLEALVAHKFPEQKDIKHINTKLYSHQAKKHTQVSL